VISTSLPEPDPLRLLTEYVLHMSITCLGDQDVTPLYEEYVQDSRLGEAERAELTAVYRSLLPRVQATATP
jgi:hypothetical protein